MSIVDEEPQGSSLRFKTRSRIRSSARSGS